MKDAIMHIFGFRRDAEPKAYDGFSDFFLRASEAEKRRVITEAAKMANLDQMEVYRKAGFETPTR